MNELEAKIGNIVGEACGAVSLCWEPKPTGEFDSSLAVKYVDEAIKKIMVELTNEAI